MNHKHYPSLLLIMNSRESKWYRVEENGIAPVSQLVDTYDRYTDDEGFFKSSFRHGDSVKAGAPELENQRRRQHSLGHIKRTAQKTKQVWNSADYVHLCCVMPGNYSEEMRNRLNMLLPGVAIHEIHGLYAYLPSTELRGLFLRSLRPPP